MRERMKTIIFMLIWANNLLLGAASLSLFPLLYDTTPDRTLLATMVTAVFERKLQQGLRIISRTRNFAVAVPL